MSGVTQIFSGPGDWSANRIGFRFVPPTLPDGLPAGLVAAYLTRSGAAQSRHNLVTRTMDVTVAGTPAYSGTEVSFGTGGWLQTGIVQPDDFTFLASYRVLDHGAIAIGNFRDITTPGGIGASLFCRRNSNVSYASVNVGQYTGSNNPTNALNAHDVNAIIGENIIHVGTHKVSTKTLKNYVPLLGVDESFTYTNTYDKRRSSDALRIGGAYPAAGSGYLVGATLQFAAIWLRTLTADEVAAAHEALQPWLEERGIVFHAA